MIWIALVAVIAATVFLIVIFDDEDATMVIFVAGVMVSFFLLIVGIVQATDGSSCRRIGELTGKEVNYSLTDGCLVKEDGSWVEIEKPGEYFDKTR